MSWSPGEFVTEFSVFSFFQKPHQPYSSCCPWGINITISTLQTGKQRKSSLTINLWRAGPYLGFDQFGPSLNGLSLNGQGLGTSLREARCIGLSREWHFILTGRETQARARSFNKDFNAYLSPSAWGTFEWFIRAYVNSDYCGRHACILFNLPLVLKNWRSSGLSAFHGAWSVRCWYIERHHLMSW